MKPALAGAAAGTGAMAPGPGSFRVPVLPWANAAADEQRFRGILRGCLLAALTLALALPWMQLTAVDRQAPQPLPAPITRLLLQRQAPAARPDAKADRQPQRSPDASPAQDRPTVAAPGRAAPLPPTARLPVDGRQPGAAALDQARRKAAGSGLLALKNEISALSAALPALALKPDTQPAPGVGTTGGAGAGAGSDAGEPARALVTASVGRSSGGVASAASSRDSGGGGLTGRATTMLAGTGAAAGGSGFAAANDPWRGGKRAGGAAGVDSVAAFGQPGAAAALPRGSGRATRSIEDIKLVFERQKGAIYALYNRALRDDPALQGKVVLELRIAPGGQVTDLRIVSSELKSEDLERKLLARIRQFDFGAKDVDALVLTWPVDFLPS